MIVERAVRMLEHLALRYLACGGVLLCLASPVRAADWKPGEEITGEAARHYKKGREFYRNERYEKAARRMRRALELTEHPLLFYNAALAEWRAGRLEEAYALAVRAEQQRLPESVDAKNTSLKRGLGVRLEAADVAERIENRPRSTDAPRGPESRGRDGLTGLGWGGIAGLTLGVGALSGSIWIDRRLARKSGRLRSAARNYELDKFDRLQSEIQTEKTVGLVLLGGGVVFTGVGGYMLIRDLVGGRQQTGGRSASRRSSGLIVRPTWGMRRLGVELRMVW